MDVKVGDICWLAPYDQVREHAGIYRHTWDYLAAYPVRIVSVGQADVGIRTTDPNATDGVTWYALKDAIYNQMPKAAMEQYDTDIVPPYVFH